MRLIAVAGMVAMAVPHAGWAQAGVRFTLPRDTALVDEKILIGVTGVRPGSFVTVRLTLPAGPSSAATFVADREGRIALATARPVAGSYSDPDAMGLFWSTRAPGTAAGAQAAPNRAVAAAVPAQLTAEIDGRVVATDTVWRRAVAPDVRITRVRESGVVGVLYEPPGTSRRPAVVVLPGSNGGTPAAAQWPGALASRGYVVLSLAYFNEEGLAKELANMPLEYFEKAIEWLRARPTVQPDRVGILGTSRGGETALLVASTYPRLVRAVVALVPSSVVWTGCCDSTSRLAPPFTLRGSPVPHMPGEDALEIAVSEFSRTASVRQTPVYLHRLTDTAAAARAAIPVERIRGPILLISGRDDGVWPSSLMSEQVVARLKRHRFGYPYQHLALPDAGHFILRPYTTTMDLNDQLHPVSGRRNDAGGTPVGTARARERAWMEILRFFDRQFKQSATQ